MMKTLAPSSPDDLWPMPEPAQAGTGTPSLLQRLGAVLGGLAAHLIERHRQLKAEGELRALDDRMLRDIGLRRSEIGRVVRYGRFG